MLFDRRLNVPEERIPKLRSVRPWYGALRQKHWAEAVEAFQASLRLSTPTADLYTSLGDSLYFADREQEEALAAVDRALEIDPDHAPAYAKRGNGLLRRLRRYEEAVRGL